MRFAVLALLFALVAVPANAGYGIFNPTPQEARRDMSADRPDLTESPHTVDAGVWQLEMSFVDYSETGDDNSISLAPLNLKIGLASNADLQIVVTPFVDIESGGVSVDGTGDLQFRLKINLWGNDGQSSTAFALMPFVKIPTASDGLGNDEVEGGLILPLGFGISETAGVGLMLEADFVYNPADDSYDTEIVTTGVVGLDATERIGLYVEGVGVGSTNSDTDYRALLGLGITFAVTPGFVLDAGTNLGLTDSTDDLNVFSGFTKQF